MDPVTLATITSGATVLATEVGKGLASAAAQDAWARMKALFGWRKEPAPAELAPAIAQRLASDEATARAVVNLLREQAASSSAAAIVGQINAEKVVVIHSQVAGGDINFQM